jgi:hypothetical protein
MALDPHAVIDLALAIRQGQRRLADLSVEQQAAVQHASRRMTDAQFSRLAEQRESRSRVSTRGFGKRGLHDGRPTR